jgi:hypothetical protein
VNHKTEAIYRRYAIQDEAMLREGAARLDAWDTAQQASAAKATGAVTPMRRRPT